MIKTIIITAMVMFAGVTAPPAQAGNEVCNYLDANPTVTGAEDMITKIAIYVLENNIDMDTAAEDLVQTIYNGCPEYLGIVKQAALNLGG
jgi:hypothetical protein